MMGLRKKHWNIFLGHPVPSQCCQQLAKIEILGFLEIQIDQACKILLTILNKDIGFRQIASDQFRVRG